MEEVKNMEEVKEKYVVYSHSYNDELFYIGSGRIYAKKEWQTSRPYDFHGRNKKWFEFCGGETDKIKVEILFETTDKQLARGREEELTKTYIEKGYKLVNESIGNHHSAETKKKLSLANKNGKSPVAKKVLVTNNKNGESKIFDSIMRAYEFIVENGFNKTSATLNNNLNKGSYNFKEYTFELAK